jgi:hypothetical protein
MKMTNKTITEIKMILIVGCFFAVPAAMLTYFYFTTLASITAWLGALACGERIYRIYSSYKGKANATYR